LAEKNYKGIGVCFVREQLTAKGPEAVDQLLAGLDEEDQKTFKYTLATTWIDIHAGMRIIGRAAEILYPGDPVAMQTVAYNMARNHLTGVYRILLRVMTVKFALSQTANYWGAYHRIGRATHVREGIPRKARLLIEDYPDLPESFLVHTNGYIIGLLELSGARNVTVDRKALGDDRWAWDVDWD